MNCNELGAFSSSPTQLKRRGETNEVVERYIAENQIEENIL